MNFSIQQFIATNKRILLWSIFFLLLYLVRRLFGLVFLTFILCFIFSDLILRLEQNTRLPRRIWTVIVYLVFVAVVVTLVSFVAPRLTSESTAFLRQVPQTLEKIHVYLDHLSAEQPNLAPVMEATKSLLSLERLVGVKGETLVNVAVSAVNQVTHYFTYFLLGTLFSFFILLDFPNLKARTMALRNTRLKEVYDETAVSIVRFARVVGAAFRAQVMIACVNTLFTAVGLYGLNIHPISLLSTIVFFCGLIPVLGVFISSVPIFLLSFNKGGFPLSAAALVMIIIIHSIEAYILNPRIFSAIFKINPVLTLIILYLGHRLFGMWGVLLGVPISVYIYRYAILGHQNGPTGTGLQNHPKNNKMAMVPSEGGEPEVGKIDD